MSSWNLQDQFRGAIDRWYLILGFILLGSMAGFLISSITPAPYRAEADLYVGINITRVNEMEYLIPLAEEEPLNLDDYKNWQLKQLSDIFYSDPVLEDALWILQDIDPIWKEVSLEEFRSGLDIYWYDTGIWRLQYQDSDRGLAEAAVQAWLDAGYDYVTGLLVVSEQAAALDAQLEINKDAASALKTQAARISNFLATASDWLAGYPELDGESPLTAEEHEAIWSWAAAGLSGVAVWQPRADFPAEGAPAAEYQHWLVSTSAQAEVVLEELDGQLALLQQEREEILPAYHQSLDDSLGLSANIVLQENSAVPHVTRVRERGTVSLAGAFLGLLGWLIYFVIQVRGRHENKR